MVVPKIQSVFGFCDMTIIVFNNKTAKLSQTWMSVVVFFLCFVIQFKLLRAFSLLTLFGVSFRITIRASLRAYARAWTFK